MAQLLQIRRFMTNPLFRPMQVLAAFTAASLLSFSARAEEPRYEVFATASIGLGTFELGPRRPVPALDNGFTLGFWSDHLMVGLVERNVWTLALEGRTDTMFGVTGGIGQRFGRLHLQLLAEAGGHIVDLGWRSPDTNGFRWREILVVPYASVSPALSIYVPEGPNWFFIRIEPFVSYDLLHPIGTSTSPSTGLMVGQKVGGLAMGVRFTFGAANQSLLP